MRRTRVHYAFNARSFKPQRECSAVRGAERASYAVNDFISDLIAGVARDLFSPVFFPTQPPPSCPLVLPLLLFQARGPVDFTLSVRAHVTYAKHEPELLQTLLARERAPEQKSGHAGALFPQKKFAAYRCILSEVKLNCLSEARETRA